MSDIGGGRTGEGRELSCTSAGAATDADRSALHAMQGLRIPLLHRRLLLLRHAAAVGVFAARLHQWTNWRRVPLKLAP